ncbi:sensor histidine kinase [Paenibacillus sp. CAA11]|uniref:sensor histidine kinase n=1 Tax=Paenibacillus sp. CAA11 TaxID=1532905 RepID=UPI000D389779|nr:sensor histidine kinase [Paenibacillus sp. CAA11]AWB44771.1 sensor histidine kinase [Paenibacillus sp. CAA11]
MRKRTAYRFVKDRLGYLLLSVILSGLGVGLLLLERLRTSTGIEKGTMIYYGILCILIIIAWFSMDYIRHRRYLGQLELAVRDKESLPTVIGLSAPVSHEQHLVVQLMKQQHAIYLSELGRYRREQELHNHFVLQWVHHMKTPVSVIDLLAQEGEQESLLTEQEQKELFRNLQEETDRLNHGLELMLHTARLGKFEMDLRPSTIALHDLIRKTVNTYKHLCIRHSIFPEIQGQMWVQSDVKWLTVVLHQLISNSIKYSKSKPGVKQLQFRLFAAVADGTKSLEVVDNGIGIAAHDLPRIFDAFFTGEDRHESGESTGMGLYLAKQACSRLGHGLTAESERGAWTKMTVLFHGQTFPENGRREESDRNVRKFARNIDESFPGNHDKVEKS